MNGEMWQSGVWVAYMPYVCIAVVFCLALCMWVFQFLLNGILTLGTWFFIKKKAKGEK